MKLSEILPDDELPNLLKPHGGLTPGEKKASRKLQKKWKHKKKRSAFFGKQAESVEL